MRRRWVALIAVVAVAFGTGGYLWLRPTPITIDQQALTLPAGPTSATDPTPVKLDAELYLPASTPAPAVVLAHGFGGSKASVADDAKLLAERGYVVLAYTARGFGKSDGQISLDSPDFEVADARKLIDFLATQRVVQSDGSGDPRVAVAGSSYGGALALLTAGYDQRVDAVAANITWSDLQSALFPQSVVGSSTTGVFKQMWTGYLFSVGMGGGATRSVCGRFAPEWCAVYNEAVSTGALSANAVALMKQSSPIDVADQITAPTLLVQGEADSLFPLDQADATARAIAGAHPGTPLKVVWQAGGHDGGVNENDRVRSLMADWFDRYLQGDTSKDPAAAEFEVSMASGSLISSSSAAKQPTVKQRDTYPGVLGSSTASVKLSGPQQPIIAPPGGVPATISALPGAGAAASLLGRPYPGQAAFFSSEPMDRELQITGSSLVKLLVSAPAVVRDAVLFASLTVVSSSGASTLPNGLVAPIRLAEIGPVPQTVTVRLPAVVTSASPGERLVLQVATTDAAYKLPATAATYIVALAEPDVAVATVDLAPTTSAMPAYYWPAGAGALALLIILFVWLVKPRARRGDYQPNLAEVPIAVVDVVKEFKNGVRAVDGISFEIPAGKVIGLLGPNGAGKTTLMRMTMGLIRPSKGAVYVFGQRVRPGSSVLARIGALVEGPGFLPHLSGRSNLKIYWRASGRLPRLPQLGEVLEIANLGTAADRLVRTYSQGMRQRLGIAQAMLGMPDLLMLDEPTNGLDPPQIKEMRDVLHDYAATGRTVIISSHMLSEVEQTCNYVVVMHRGKLVKQGSVASLLAGRSGMRLEDFFMEVVGKDLTVGKS